MRVNTNVSQRAQQQLVLENFGGVDFSSSPLLMASNRASYACNLINDNGVNHKRPGWEEQLKVEGKINGIYPYDANGHKALIIYAGTTFYEAEYDETSKKYEAPTKLTVTLPEGKQLENNRVQFFPQRDKVYIIGCGDYLVYGDFDGKYELKRVVDTEVYVPTTSISGEPQITNSLNTDEIYKDAKVGAILDDVNLLTRKRKNTFRGMKYITETLPTGIPKYTYYTDTQFDPSTAVITVEQFGKNEVTYTKTAGDSENWILKFDIDNNTKKAKGFITQLAWNYADEDSDYANVTIEFEAVDVESEAVSDLDASAITGCRFGTLFGAGGASDRLFLSGNPDYPNADFYSEFDDYTYFTAQSQTVMGSDDIAITGYVRLSDSTLATMKAGAVYEPSIYYRQAYEKDAYIDEEKTVKKIVFTKWSGGTGEACISPHVISSLAEDDLILSPNGVFGIVEVNNAATNSRYMRERSAFINGKLLNEPRLSEAVSFVYKNRYYLAVPTDAERNGAVYVADPRFKSYRSDDIDSSFNYEWWYWENVPARVFANIDGQLWFGCEDGRVCRFDEQFTDRTKNHAESFTVGDGHVTVSEDVIKGLNNGDKLEFDSNIYCEYLSVAEVVGGKIKCKADEIIHIYAGTEVYADSVGGSGLSVATQYKVGDVDRGNRTFSLRKKDSKEDIELNEGGFRLCRNMKEKKLYIRNIDDSICTFEFSEFDDSEPVKIVRYNEASVYDGGTLTFDYLRPVCSTWYTPVFSLGATDVLKTLLRMTVSVDPIIKGEVKFGYETRDVQRLLTAKVNSTLDFEDFSFEEFSFASEFATSYTVKSKARKFNYIMFKFMSDNDRDCAINNFKAIYTLTASHRGVF